MWAVERDPVLRSTFLNLTVLDRPPDIDRLRERMADAITAFPRLRQRVRAGGAPWDRPHWVDDASFDVAYHVRRVALPPPGSPRELLDLAALWLEDAFDPVRPLWQLTVVEGLAGGRAALLVKMHHTITDGVGGMRLSSSFLDLDRAGGMPLRPPAGARAPRERPGAAAPAARASLAGQIGDVLRAVQPVSVLRQARGLADTVLSIARQGAVMGPSGSPLWRGRRSMGRRLDTIDLDLDAVRDAAHALGGTVNDVFVTGVAGGAADYHRKQGVDVDHLRASVPVNTRQDASFGGNSFAPARVVVPAGITDPGERFRAVHDAMGRVRSERALRLVDTLASVLLALPPAVLTPIARQQVATVDFAASNLRGSPVELFVAGAAVEANYPFGPTAGIAFNATVLSYRNRLDLGLVVDVGAVDDPVLLRDCLENSLADVVRAGV